MEQDHNPQNSMSLSERKTSLSVRSQEERDGNGSLKPAPAPVGGFSQGCGGHGQGFAPVTEALGSFLPPDSDCKWRTDAAQLQHPGRPRTGRLHSPALPASLPSSPARPLPRSSACALESVRCGSRGAATTTATARSPDCPPSAKSARLSMNAAQPQSFRQLLTQSRVSPVFTTCRSDTLWGPLLSFSDPFVSHKPFSVDSKRFLFLCVFDSTGQCFGPNPELERRGL